MIKFEVSGSFKNTEKFLKTMQRGSIFNVLDSYGQMGVDALSNATPVDSSLTANSWKYEIINKPGKYEIVWRNTNVKDGIPIAVLIQYGHGTKNGGWVEGRDYINPAIQPLFDKITKEIWERVRRA